MGPNAYHALLVALVIGGIGAFFVVMPVVDFQLRSRLRENRPAWYRAVLGASGLGVLMIAFYVWVIARFW